ncbi:MAG: hypothetical protein KC620_24075 [Myxococcales bacterium]|nr:hypothetical protein [Myxococcales bacterium]
MIDPPEGRPLPELTGLLRSVAGLPALARNFRALPRGEGAPVLVLPGFMTSDRSTFGLRRFLGRLGYDAHGWGLGRNHGYLDRLMPQVVAKIERLAAQHGQPVRLVGWSLGGVIAREASRHPMAHVDRIITLGTPVVGGPKYTLSASYYQKNGIDVDAVAARFDARNAQPLSVPVVAIYSRSDQIVSWQACLDPNPQNRTEHIEVATSHTGLGFDRHVYRLIARHLRA